MALGAFEGTGPRPSDGNRWSSPHPHGRAHRWPRGGKAGRVVLQLQTGPRSCIRCQGWIIQSSTSGWWNAIGRACRRIAIRTTGDGSSTKSAISASRRVNLSNVNVRKSLGRWTMSRVTLEPS